MSALTPAAPPRLHPATSPDAPAHRPLRDVLTARVPELEAGLIDIVAIARDPGIGAKIAVRSTVIGIKADAACIGLHGQRIRDVERLVGEPITIALFHPDRCRLAANALRVPVLSARPDPTDPGRITITVAPQQLSRALGKGGMNVRLVARLVHGPITLNTPESS